MWSCCGAFCGVSLVSQALSTCIGSLVLKARQLTMRRFSKCLPELKGLVLQPEFIRLRHLSIRRFA